MGTLPGAAWFGARLISGRQFTARLISPVAVVLMLSVGFDRIVAGATDSCWFPPVALGS
jgi:hypothetical protein